MGALMPCNQKGYRVALLGRPVITGFGGGTEPPRNRGRKRKRGSNQITDLLADPEGNLWVQAETPDGPFWEVFSPEGALLGRVPDFPRGDRTVPYFRDDRILNVVPDSLGGETVHRLRYSRPGGREEDSSQPLW